MSSPFTTGILSFKQNLWKLCKWEQKPFDAYKFGSRKKVWVEKSLNELKNQSSLRKNNLSIISVSFKPFPLKLKYCHTRPRGKKLAYRKAKEGYKIWFDQQTTHSPAHPPTRSPTHLQEYGLLKGKWIVTQEPLVGSYPNFKLRLLWPK